MVVTPSLINAVMQIESGGNPNARTGSYSGLFQFSPELERKYGNSYEGGARRLNDLATNFRSKYGRDPTPVEVYLSHQQGEGGLGAHISNPSGLAWQNMASTAEGRQKGEGWARQAIWGNVPADVRDRYGSVDNLTSQQFMELWNDKLSRRMGSPTAQDAITLALKDRNMTPMTTGALSNRSLAGRVGGLFGWSEAESPDRLDNVGNTMTGMGAALASIGNPRQGAVLAGLKTEKPEDQWAALQGKDGTIYQYNKKTGEMRPLPGTAGSVPSPGQEMWDKEEAKKYSDLNDNLRTHALDAAGTTDLIRQTRSLVENPDVYQGIGATAVNEYGKPLAKAIGWEGAANGLPETQAMQANMKRMSLMVNNTATGKLLPGAFSNSDRDFMAQASANTQYTPEGNKILLDMAEKVSQRAMEVDAARQRYIQQHGRLDRGFDQVLSEISQKNLFSGGPSGGQPSGSRPPLNSFMR